jgi:hypothetical protein
VDVEAAPEQPESRVLHVRIHAVDFEALGALLLEGIDAGCRPHFTEGHDRRLSMQAYVREDELVRLTDRGLEVDVVADATAAGAERQAQVGRGDRFEGGRIAPRGLGLEIPGRRTWPWRRT